MKTLALLLLALSLTACAPGPPVSEELAQAEAHCGGVRPDGSRDLPCMANFSEKNYHMRLHRRRDGSLTLLAYPFGLTNDYP